MKSSISVVLVVGLFGLFSLTEDASAQQNTFFVGPSLGINAPAANMNSVGGSIGFLFGTQVQGFHLGFETGYWVYQSTFTSMHDDGTIISQVVTTARTVPVLAIAELEFNSGQSVRPYIGLGAGIGIISAQVNDEGASTAEFMAILKPGIRLSSFFIESKAGVIGGSFAFLPTLGLSVVF